MSASLNRVAIALSALLAAGCVSQDPVVRSESLAAAKQPTAAKSQLHPAAVEVVAAQFGVFGADASGRRMLFETAHLPAIVAAPYGWYILFKADKPTVVWREEFELPEAPPTWGPGEALGIFLVSPDRRTAVTERIIPTKLGFIANEWRYASGDPIGPHKMRVYIDGQLIREFSFDIEKVPEDVSPRHNPHHDPDAGTTT